MQKNDADVYFVQELMADGPGVDMTYIDLGRDDVIEAMMAQSNCSRKAAARLLEIAEYVGELDATVAGCEARAKRLGRLQRCNGTVQWLDETSMRVNHPTGQDCPTCGDRNGRPRIRKHVGVDSHKQAVAQEHIKNWRDWMAAKQGTAKARERLGVVMSQLKIVGMVQMRVQL